MKKQNFNKSIIKNCDVSKVFFFSIKSTNNDITESQYKSQKNKGKFENAKKISSISICEDMASYYDNARLNQSSFLDTSFFQNYDNIIN